MGENLEKLAAAIQGRMPQHFLSRLVYRLMRIETRWFKNFQIRLISTIVGVDWSEARSMDTDDYAHFNAFFTRELKPGARPLDPHQSALVSPCDGRISQMGPIRCAQLLQAKGVDYSLQALLAGDPDWKRWVDGCFYTIYLSPRDYHRVHMPLDASLERMSYVPGRLFSVAPYTVRQIPGLFARNERVISIFATEVGPVAQVLVGAMLVSGIETVWAGEITPAKTNQPETIEYGGEKVRLHRGTEMGRFNMGSTVILLLPPGAVDPEPGLEAGQSLNMGQRIGMLRQPGA